ncbi:MAG: dihydroneopterin aldolase [Bacteroidetes bacterium OLB11]|nr:MAG: dihydroneopterin aldolase [Bacteroidetes bacterium OLB11]
MQTIHDTIDYSNLLNTIKRVFSNREDLLETIAQNVEQECLILFKGLKYFYFSIQKFNPALNAKVQSSEVILEKTY